MRFIFCIALVFSATSVIAAEPPTAPRAVDQDELTVEPIISADSVVVDIADGNAILVRQGGPRVDSEKPLPTTGPTTERIELDAPPVNIVNTTRHFRIISLKDPQPEAAETTAQDNDE